MSLNNNKFPERGNKMGLSHIDEHVVKLLAGLVAILTGIILFDKSGILALALAVDFYFRAFTVLVSPLALIARAINKGAGWSPKPVFAHPKKFAAGIGFAFSFALGVLFLLQFFIAAYFTGGVLITCALLESCFGICVGCYVYNWFVVPFKNKRFS
jgi:hypothetical protein